MRIMDNGYIVISRNIFEWEWADDPHTGWLWINILLLANWKDKQWHGEEIKRGQLITSIKNLSEISGLSIQQVRASLKKLEKTMEIIKKATNKYTLITVVKYDTYQTSGNYTQQTNNKQTTNKQQQLNKDKKDNKDNKEIIHGQFEEFWHYYGKKIQRTVCERWYVNNVSNGLHKEIMEGITKWKNSGNWNDIQYQPYPMTFLNQRRWMDDPPPSKNKSPDGIDHALINRILRGEE